MKHTDRARPAQACTVRALPAHALLLLIRGYRYFFKPWLGNSCRFEPTCSAYAMQAIERHGAIAGGELMTRRLMRCHPWCDGGCDPVPIAPPRLFTRFLSKTRP